MQTSESRKSQHDKFKQAAKDLGCDEDEARFDDTVKKLAKAGGKKDNLKYLGKN